MHGLMPPFKNLRKLLHPHDTVARALIKLHFLGAVGVLHPAGDVGQVDNDVGKLLELFRGPAAGGQTGCLFDVRQ